jgi:hypothetical protein
MVSSQILQFDRYPLSSLSEIRRSAAFVIALVRFNNPTAKIIVFLSPDQVFTIHGITPRDVLARRVPVSAFCRYRVSLQRKKCCQQIIGLNDESVFRAVRSPNLLLEGETGFMVEDIDSAVEAVGKIEQISRARCRREFEQRFTDRHIAEEYIRIYQQLLSRSSTQAAA